MKNLFRRDFVRGGVHFFSAALINSYLYRNSYFDGQVNPKDLSDAVRDGMILYSKRYLTLETPPGLMNSWIIPTKHFYVRNNLLMPEAVDIAQWRLQISGEVKTPVTLTYDELNKLPTESVANTLECAGNGRVNYKPKIGGVPWGRGGVGNATFEGCSLKRLLEKAGLKGTARHVAFRGLDTPPSGSEDFVRSIPVAKAMDDATLVATKMNGEALTPAHGYPARTLVPGWIGAASIKWLTEIVVLADEYKGFFMDPGYRIPSTQTGNNSSRSTSLTSLRLKSIITEPAEDKLLSQSSNSVVKISGAAWGGEATVAGVSVSTDGGRSWKQTRLGTEHAKYSWRLWTYEWSPPRAGEYIIQSRAFDTKGNVQPATPVWNAGGYLWNGIDQVRVRIQ